MRCTEQVQRLIADVVKPGDTVIDATMGNGHDTLALARAVGAAGSVWAFDVQQQAIHQTRKRLVALCLLERCHLIQGCHSEMERLLTSASINSGVQMVVFNLGYLPGGEKSTVTTAITTRHALDCACRLLAPGGYLAVTAYTGHPGAVEEASEVAGFFNQLANLPAWSINECPVPQSPAPCVFVGRKIF